jgi:hypothetical protein
VLALVVIQTFVVLALAVLVAGLLRSHAEILRALHALGAGDADVPVAAPRPLAGRPAAGPATIDGEPAHDIGGTDPWGGAVHVGISGSGRTTLLAFLSGGCTTCASFWDAFGRPEGPPLPVGVDRLVVVTRGAERESPAEIAARAPRPPSTVGVVMSTEAWSQYRVPVTPYFVLVDGRGDRVVGEGAAAAWPQLESLLVRALADGEMGAAGGRGAGGGQRARADSALQAAGIQPGHPSLHPPAEP